MKQIMTILLLIFPISGFTQTQTTWDVSLWGERRAFTEHIERLAELVDRKTNGEFTLNLSYGELASPSDNLGGIAIDAFDLAQICAGFHVDKTPSLTVLELPYLPISTLSEQRSLGQELLRQPAILDELAQYNAIALMPTPLPQQNLAGIGDSPRTLSDLAGLRIRATSGTAQAMEALGALPTLIVATEVREAMGNAQINAAAFAPHEHMSFGTIANATWWTENLNPGTVNCPVVANIKSINQLPPQHIEALYNSINESLDHYVQNYEYNLSQSWEPVLKELNVEKVYFNDYELEAFRDDAAAVAAQQWIQENTARGVDAQALYESVVISVYGGDIRNVPDVLPVLTERKKKQKILDSYAFNRVPNQAEQPIPEPEPEPARTFSFNKKQNDQQEELPIAKTIPFDLPEQNTRVENISDVTLAALPASAAGPTIYNGKLNRPSAQTAPVRELPQEQLPLATTSPVNDTPNNNTPKSNTPKYNTRVENISQVTLAALPASASGPMIFSTSNDRRPTPVTILTKAAAEPSNSSPVQKANTYFGPPRNGSVKSLSANPLDVAVEWDLDINATVGGTLQQLARYIGYELVDNNIVNSVLNRRLPAVHRKVKSISVADGFKVVSGRGLLTVFNHIDRTVEHLQQKTSNNENLSLSVCPDNISLASFSREGVLKLSDGSECLYQ